MSQPNLSHNSNKAKELGASNISKPYKLSFLNLNHNPNNKTTKTVVIHQTPRRKKKFLIVTAHKQQQPQQQKNLDTANL